MDRQPFENFETTTVLFLSWSIFFFKQQLHEVFLGASILWVFPLLLKGAKPSLRVSSEQRGSWRRGFLATPPAVFLVFLGFFWNFPVFFDRFQRL